MLPPGCRRTFVFRRLYIIGISDLLGGGEAADAIVERIQQIVALRGIAAPRPILGPTGVLDTEAAQRSHVQVPGATVLVSTWGICL